MDEDIRVDVFSIGTKRTVRLIHIPSGFTASSCNELTTHANKEKAYKELMRLLESNNSLRFTCDYWHRIKNRGFIAYVNETLPKGVWDPNSLVNKEVYINDEKFIVAGVEKFAIGYSERFPYSLKFGLMVK